MTPSSPRASRPAGTAAASSTPPSDSQTGALALVPQVVDAVGVPVIAAVQLGTAYLFCPEAKLSPVFRAALDRAGDDGTVITNVLSGRPARAVRNRCVDAVAPPSDAAPDFPATGARGSGARPRRPHRVDRTDSTLLSSHPMPSHGYGWVMLADFPHPCRLEKRSR